MFLPCLRAMVGLSEFSYLCNLTSAQLGELRARVASERITDARVGMAFVRGGDDTDWFPVSVGNNPQREASEDELEAASAALSLLRIGDAEVLELAVPEGWREGADCLIEFRAHTAMPAVPVLQ